MTTLLKAEIETAMRRVFECKGFVSSQRSLIFQMKMADFPTSKAEDLLVHLEDALSRHEAHLARLEGKRGHDLVPGAVATLAPPMEGKTL